MSFDHLKREAHHNAKLREPDIVVIRKRRAAGESQPRIARDFNVSAMQISRIVRGLHWPG
ncbi:hypothetical protein ABC347_07965 [Sphingomonas sp. 1P06PA]|uniref:hypothetical protein n=1 Tax=Sphingomonas sp. 1P06PA TaxID=554121 RepID=UPI0039A713C8